MKQREIMTNEQARERIAMDCSCHEHARKPQPGNEFHKVVPGLPPSSRNLRTVAVVMLTFWTSPVDHSDRLPGKVTKIDFVMYS